VRIAAVGAALSVRAMAHVAMPPAAPVGTRVQQDPSVWWNATSAALRALDLSGLEVRALAVDGTSGTILEVRDDGSPAGLASMYADRADDAHVQCVVDAAPPDTAALGHSSPLARALRFRTAGTRLVHQADWIAAQFTGRLDVTDENNALKTGYDPRQRAWPSWLDDTGLDTTRLPRVVPAGTELGAIRSSIAREFGLPEDVAIVAGTTDGCAAFLASGASQPGDGVTSLGTTLTVKLLSDTPVVAPAFGVYSHRIGDQWLAGGASNTGGGVLAAHFSRDDLARLTPRLRPDQPTGLDYYPLVTPGERFPIDDPHLAPRLLPRPADDASFLQGMLEGMAAIEGRAYATLASLGASPLRTMRTTGGGAVSDAWTALRRRVLGVPMLPASSPDAAVGAARLAWRGLDRAR
jgi:D-ribulokinase